MQSNKPLDSRIFLLTFVIFGMIFLIVGIIVGTSNAKTKKICTEKVQAEVVNILSHTSSSGSGRKKHTSTVYCPVFEFEFNNQTYTAHTNNYSSPCKYDKGETYEIYFNPDKPSQIYLPNDKTATILSVVFSIIGGVFVLICLIIAIKITIDKKKKKFIRY